MPLLLALLFPWLLEATTLQMQLAQYRHFVWYFTLATAAIIAGLFLLLKEQKRLKSELREQKEAFETLFEKAHDGILLIEDGHFTACNEAIVRMLGFPSKEAVLKAHPSELSPKYQPDGRSSFEKAEEMMHLALEQGYNQFEWVHTRASGTRFWSEIVLTKINLHGKDVIHVVWRDIYERKKLEEEIRELNRQLEQKVAQRTDEQQILLSLFDKGKSVLFKWHNDETWSLDYVSGSVSKVLGYSREDFLSQAIVYTHCIHPDDIAHVTHELEEAVKSQKEYFEHDPYRILTRSGEVKWVHDSTVIVRNRAGDITHFLGYISDITDIREKGRQLLRLSRLVQTGAFSKTADRVL